MRKKLIIPLFFLSLFFMGLFGAYYVTWYKFKNNNKFTIEEEKTKVAINDLPSHILIKPNHSYFYKTKIQKKYYTEGFLIKVKSDTISNELREIEE